MTTSSSVPTAEATCHAVEPIVTKKMTSTRPELLVAKTTGKSPISHSPSDSMPMTCLANACKNTKRNEYRHVSAVYRWYKVEDELSVKKREASSIAKCHLCTAQGKVDIKTWVRFSKSVTSNLWRHLKENHPDVYEKHAGEKKKSGPLHRLNGKKRGRKKKNKPCSEPGAMTLICEAEGSSGLTLGDRQVPVQKAQRSDHVPSADQQLNRVVPHQVCQRTGAWTTGHFDAEVTGKLKSDKVLEAMGYFCLFEMLPFELCSSHGFRNLMVQLSGGTGRSVDDANNLTLCSTEIVSEYAKKMAAEMKMRTAMQMKTTDFSHLMLSEWRSSDSQRVEPAVATSVASLVDCTHSSDKEMVFVALCAVGLDQDFNPFLRCLHVSAIDSCCSRQEISIAAMFAGDKELTKAMECVVPCKHMPEILAVEPPCCGYQSFAVDHNLCVLESVPTVLQKIVLATINGVCISGSYCLARDVLETPAASNSLGFRNRRLDKGEYIERTSAVAAVGSSTDDVYNIYTVETASRIMEELPTSLTGHTYRDLMNKVMHLLAHFKQSSRSRTVLRRLALEQCSMSIASYERVFIDRLREMTISVSQIYSVLALVEDMMLPLKEYFFMHKNNDSDYSKLVQLSCLSMYEWSRVCYLTVILKPFAEATANLDGEPYAISSLIVPSVFTLIEKTRDLHLVNTGFTDESYNGSAKKSAAEAMVDLPEDIEAFKDLAFSNLLACFGHLFSVPQASWSMEKLQTFNLLWSATILDPRTRSFIVKGSLPQQEFWEIVKAEATNMAGTKEKDKDNDLRENSIAMSEDCSHLNENGISKGTNLWDDLQAKLTSCAKEEMLLSSTKSSLEMIQSSNLLEVEVSFFQEEGCIVLRANPLEWWQNTRMKYPFLARLARYVLSIPCKVKIDDNPVLFDKGLVKRGPSQMKMAELCDLLAASMNLRMEKNTHFENASKQVWSTV